MSQTHLAMGIKYNLISSPARTLLVSPTSPKGWDCLSGFLLGKIMLRIRTIKPEFPHRDILDDPDWHELDGDSAKALTAMKRKSMNPSLRLRIYKRDKGKCCFCGESTRFFRSSYDSPFDDGPKAGTVDHIIPVSKGGTNDESNLRWMCRSCNCSRGNRSCE